MKRSVIVALSVLLLAGCSSAPEAPAPSTSAKPTFAVGASATAIANAVSACKKVAQEVVPASATDIASLATCEINGAPVEFYSWKTATASAGALDGSGAPETYYAASETWSTLPTVEGDVPGQKAVAEVIVKALGGKVVHYAP